MKKKEVYQIISSVIIRGLRYVTFKTPGGVSTMPESEFLKLTRQ